MKKLIPLLLLSSMANANLISTVDVHANAAAGFTNQNIPVQCQHHIYVTNNSDSAVTATAYYRVCADGHSCNETKVEQRMEPHVNWENNFTSQYAYTFTYAGNYQLRCNTTVAGSASNDDVNNISVN